MNDRCLPSGANPGGSAFHLVARVKVSRVFRKQVLTCSNSLVSAKPYFGKPPKKRSAFTTTRAAQLGSYVLQFFAETRSVGSRPALVALRLNPMQCGPPSRQR